MAVASLRYRPNSAAPEENKFGYIVFSGDAVDYYSWLFRTELKFKVTKDEEFSKTMTNVIENLRGDALSVAMEIGMDELLKPDTGAKKLFDAILEHVFPIARHESKALYKEGHKTREGVFVRQPSESMQSYILRRKRWWSLLQKLDDSVKLSDEHLGDMLLDSANILDWQRQLILTSTNNSTKFAEVEEALMEQLSLVHRKESRAHEKGKGRSKSDSPFRPRPYYGGGKPFRRVANIAESHED